MIVLQLLLYCLLFTAMVKIAVIGGTVNGLYFYPKEVQDRAIELGLSRRHFQMSSLISSLISLVKLHPL